VKDKQSNELLGHFYLDLHPRDNKYGHAAVFPLIKRAVVDGKVTPSAAAMVVNFAKGTNERPALLQMDNVITFFHEFGHIMHNVCSKANFSRLSGTSVERDFVELPSQMLENWVENKDVLIRLSKHYKTGVPLPLEFVEKRKKANKMNEASNTLNQVQLGTYDFVLHTALDEDLLKQNLNQVQTHAQTEEGEEATAEEFNIDDIRR